MRSRVCIRDGGLRKLVSALPVQASKKGLPATTTKKTKTGNKAKGVSSSTKAKTPRQNAQRLSRPKRDNNSILDAIRCDFCYGLCCLCPCACAVCRNIVQDEVAELHDKLDAIVAAVSGLNNDGGDRGNNEDAIHFKAKWCNTK